jgi:hypothetical protein
VISGCARRHSADPKRASKFILAKYRFLVFVASMCIYQISSAPLTAVSYDCVYSKVKVRTCICICNSVMERK